MIIRGRTELHSITEEVWQMPFVNCSLKSISTLASSIFELVCLIISLLLIYFLWIFLLLWLLFLLYLFCVAIWANEARRQRFFKEFADKHKFSVYDAEKWYTVSREAIISAKVFFLSFFSHIIINVV